MDDQKKQENSSEKIDKVENTDDNSKKSKKNKNKPAKIEKPPIEKPPIEKVDLSRSACDFFRYLAARSKSSVLDVVDRLVNDLELKKPGAKIMLRIPSEMGREELKKWLEIRMRAILSVWEKKNAVNTETDK